MSQYFLAPLAPYPPEVLSKSTSEMIVALNPVLETNGPILSYLVIVKDSSSPVIINKDYLFSWSDADLQNIPYYITAEIKAEVSNNA